MASGPKKSARAPLIAAPAFAPAPVVFAPEPAEAMFDPGPAPADLAHTESAHPELAHAESAPNPIEAAWEPVAIEPAPVAITPAVVVEKLEDLSAAVAAPIVEAMDGKAAVAALHPMQEKARSLIEKSLIETRAHYAKAKSAADEATSALEASLVAAKTGAIDFHAKALAAIKAQAESSFDFAKAVVAVKSPSDYVTLHTQFARQQIETMTTHSKEMGVLAQKFANDTAAPIKAHIAKTFKIAV